MHQQSLKPPLSHREKKETSLSARERLIYDFLKSHTIGVLTVIDRDWGAHSSVVNFCTGTNFHLSFLVKTDSRKYYDLLRDRRILLTVFDSNQHATAEIRGMAKTIKQSPDLIKVSKAVLGNSCEKNIHTKVMNGELYRGFTIIPQQIRLSRYAPFDSANTQPFDSVESFDLVAQRD